MLNDHQHPTNLDTSHWKESLKSKCGGHTELKQNRWCQTSSLSASKTLKLLTSPLNPPSPVSVDNCIHFRDVGFMGDCTQLIQFLAVQKEILVPKARQWERRGENQDEFKRQKRNSMKSRATGLGKLLSPAALHSVQTLLPPPGQPAAARENLLQHLPNATSNADQLWDDGSLLTCLGSYGL